MRFLVIAMFAIFLGACSSSPWAVIDGSMSKAADPKNFDVVISGVDGKLFMDGQKVRRVDPGMHMIRVTTTKVDAFGKYTYDTVPFVAEPCMRYFVAAQHESSVSTDNKRWTLVVIREEPIKSCLKLLEEEKA